MSEITLDQKIQQFLKEENPSFNEGLRLYAAHPNHRKNVVMVSERRYRHGSTHLKLIYELEKLIGVEKHSGRTTVLKESPLNVPFAIIKKTEAEAPSNFKYETTLDDLPEELKELVIVKGELYRKNSMIKKELAATGKNNDDASILKRQQLRAEMHQNYETIVNSHKILMEYDKSKTFEITVKTDKPVENTELSLEEEYNYEVMSWAERKLLLKKIQSNLAKQLERSKSSKKEKARNDNAKKAIRTKSMLDILDAYFAENHEAPK